MEVPRLMSLCKVRILTQDSEVLRANVAFPNDESQANNADVPFVVNVKPPMGI